MVTGGSSTEVPPQPHGISGIKKMRKYENMKTYVLYNPKGAMRSIIIFAGFGSFFVPFGLIFKNGLENKKIDFLHTIYFRNPEIERNQLQSKKI